MSDRIRVVKVFAAVACFVVAVSLCGCINDEEEDGSYGIEVGAELPSFTVTMNDGTTVSSRDLAGYVTVITFFNTGCQDCRQELPVVQQVYNRLCDEPAVRFLCISREEGDASVAAYWSENSFTLPYSPQSGREVYSMFASSVIPRIYVVSQSLKIAAAFSADDMPSASTLISAIAACGIDIDV